MAVASSVLSAIAFISIDLLVLLLIRFYLPLRTTPQYLLVPVFLALVIPCSIVVLVPIDLASNSGVDGSRGVVLAHRVLLVGWRIAYWLSFTLTWAILPILQSFNSSGHRDPKKRFMEALHENARYQLIMLTLGTIGLIYFIWTEGFNYTSIKSLIIALSYCYALIFAVYLMGHGLVALPRQIWRDASVAGRLRRLQTKAPRIYEELTTATEKLEDMEREVLAVRKRSGNTAPEFREWIEELAETLQLPEAATSNSRTRDRSRSPIPSVISEQYLAKLSRRLRMASQKRERYSAEWDSLVRSAANTQAILDSTASKKLTFRPNPHSITPPFLQNLPMLPPYARYFLHYHILPYVRRVLAIILSLASACIVWSEIINVSDKVSDKLSVVGYSIIHHRGSERGQIGFAGQVISAAWIGYMCAAAYNTMTSVKVWGGYALVRRRTSGASACFYASYACRLTVPLSYNFTNFLPSSITQTSVFYDFFGRSINLTRLGHGFSDWFPIFVLIPVCFTFFGFYGKVKDWFGFGSGVLDEEDAEDELAFGGGWRYGRDLIERETGGDIASATGVPERSNRYTAGSARQPGRGTADTSGLLGGSESPTVLVARSLSPNYIGRTASPRPAQPPVLQPSSRRIADDDEEEEGPIGAFFHRVKNTIDTANDGKPPKWMADIGDAFKKPKWMNNENDNAAGSSRGNPGGAGFTKPKWMKGNFFGESDDD